MRRLALGAAQGALDRLAAVAPSGRWVRRGNFRDRFRPPHVIGSLPGRGVAFLLGLDQRIGLDEAANELRPGPEWAEAVMLAVPL